jgi:hypothetical protein
MALYFRKRLGLGPLALNLSKSGVGLSLGVRGFRLGVTAHGRKYLSAGLPGTGIVYRHYQRKGKPIPVYHPIVYFGIPLALLAWIVALLIRAMH